MKLHSRIPSMMMMMTMLVSSLSSVNAVTTYHATIVEIPGTNSGVTGEVVVFEIGDETTVGYGGYIEGLQPLLEAETCTATNGCGVHIHSGIGCEDATAQGGHYFVDPVTEDPWVDARYSSNEDGYAEFADTRMIGTKFLDGRAFVVHAEDGSRVGCGLLKAVTKDETLVAPLEPLTDSSVTGEVTALSLPKKGMICYYGTATSLEFNLSSIYGDEEDATDCEATNGCGTHVHAGTDCTDATTQLGHYYDTENEDATDPWAIVGYETTTDDGFASYIGCVTTVVSEFLGKAFIVHANDGSRVSCGLLEAPEILEPSENGDDEDNNGGKPSVKPDDEADDGDVDDGDMMMDEPGTCGFGDVGNGICFDPTLCCFEDGHCGSSDDCPAGGSSSAFRRRLAGVMAAAIGAVVVAVM